MAFIKSLNSIISAADQASDLADSRFMACQQRQIIMHRYSHLLSLTYNCFAKMLKDIITLFHDEPTLDLLPILTLNYTHEASKGYSFKI